MSSSVLPSASCLREFGGAGLQRLVGQRGNLRLERVDGVDAGLVSLHPPVVGGAEKLAGERADHAEFLCSRFCVAAVTWVHQIAYQLTVTRRGPAPNRGPSANEWELSNPRFNGQKRSKISAIAIDTIGQRYGWVGALSTAQALPEPADHAKLSRNSSF